MTAAIFPLDHLAVSSALHCRDGGHTKHSSNISESFKNFSVMGSAEETNATNNISESIENICEKSELLSENFLFKPSVEKMSFRFPVLDEDRRDNSNNSQVSTTEFLNRHITATADCIWKGNGILGTYSETAITLAASPVEDHKMDSRMLTKKKKRMKKNSHGAPTDTKDSIMSDPTTSSSLQESCDSCRLSIAAMEQSIPGDSVNCDCTSLAFAQLRKSRLSVRKMRIHHHLPRENNNNDDDDSYRKCSKDSIPFNSDNIYLNPQNESSSLDSGLPSSISSSSSTSDQSGLDGSGNGGGHFSLNNNKFATDMTIRNNLLSPDKLPAPRCSWTMQSGRRLDRFSALLSNVVRKVFVNSWKNGINEASTKSLKDASLALNLNDGAYSPKWRGDDINEASPLASLAFTKNERTVEEISPKFDGNTSKNTSQQPKPTESISVKSGSINGNAAKSGFQKPFDYDIQINNKHSNGSSPTQTKFNIFIGKNIELKENNEIASQFDNKLNGFVRSPTPNSTITSPLLTCTTNAKQQTQPTPYHLKTNNSNNDNSCLNGAPVTSIKQIQFGSQTAASLPQPLAVLQLKSSIAGKLSQMKRFHYPTGVPLSREQNDDVRERVRQFFESHPGGRVDFRKFDGLCKRINFPVYTKRPLYDACCRLNNIPMPSSAENSLDATASTSSAETCGPISFAQFCVFWNKMISRAHDDSSRFIFTLASACLNNNNNNNYATTKGHHRSEDNYITKSDFMPMMMDIIDSHPGLHFLKASPQFHSRYCEVVIVRIFWNVNRSWTGHITAEELRRSNFLDTLRLLEGVTDINKVTDYFSYEHFYVTYCKFWEIDTDHDMIISRDDMREHCGGALTDRIIDRIFSAAVIRTPAAERVHRGPGPVRQQPIETIGFEDFVAFLLAEEDKRHPTSIEYWFRCIDMDGDGIISLYEMEYFYAEVEQKLLARNMETLSLTDVICNLLDSVSPANYNFVTRGDLKRCGLAHRFFNTFVNYIKYLDQESSEGERASVKTAGDREMTDWETFCAFEYELLMVETEAGSADGYADDTIDVVLDDDEHDDQTLTGIDENSIPDFKK